MVKVLKWIFGVCSCFAVAIVVLWFIGFLASEPTSNSTSSDKNYPAIVTVVSNGKFDFTVVTIEFEGHKYIGFRNGGLVHCESCSCEANK